MVVTPKSENKSAGFNESQITARLYGEPGMMDLITGKAELSDIAKRAGTSILRKITGKVTRSVRGVLGRYLGTWGETAFDYVSNRTKYVYVRNVVQRILEGKPPERNIYEIPYQGGNIAWFIGRDVYIPAVSEIPKIYGEKYDIMLKASGMDKDDFNKSQRDYILMHELVDSWFTERYGKIDPRDGIRKLNQEQHGEMEALLNEALAELHKKGYKNALNVYRASHIMHSARSQNDPFKNLTRKYLIAGEHAKRSVGDAIDMQLYRGMRLAA